MIEDVSPNIPRTLLPEYITDLTLKRFARIGKVAICEFFCRKRSLDPDIEVADSNTVIRVTKLVHCLRGTVSVRPRL